MKAVIQHMNGFKGQMNAVIPRTNAFERQMSAVIRHMDVAQAADERGHPAHERVQEAE